MAEVRHSFFSVKYTMQIGMGRFIPSVCYRLTQDIQSAVEKLAAEGSARLYAEEVRFISGVPYPVKKPERSKPAAESAAGVVTPGVEAPVGRPGKAGSRRGREFL
jgi:hypothetical protein